MSTSLNKTKSNKDESFNIEIGDKSTDEKQIYDLNEIFHIDLSYNFDLLKNLLSSIIKNQKLKDDRITELENQILDLRIAYNDGVSPNSGDMYPRKAFDGKNSLLSPYKEGENGEYLDPEEEEKLNYELKPPKKVGSHLKYCCFRAYISLFHSMFLLLFDDDFLSVHDI